MTALGGKSGQVTGDLAVDIVEAAHLDDIRGIAALYPTKTTAERAELVTTSLAPEFVEHQHGKRTILLAKLDGRVVGTAQVVWHSDDPVLSGPDTAIIHHVRTHPDFRERGVATRLLDAANASPSRVGASESLLAWNRRTTVPDGCTPPWGSRFIASMRENTASLFWRWRDCKRRLAKMRGVVLDLW